MSRRWIPPRPSDLPDAPRPPEGAAAGLCVLASGSSGNCSVLVVPKRGGEGFERVILIDAGVSPSRTRKLLAERGIALRQVDDVVLTHLDNDHFHRGWKRISDWRPALRLHAGHVRRAEREHALLRRNEPFGGELALGDRVRATTELLAHDDLGVAAFRFEITGADGRVGTLGFATDLGRVTGGLVDRLRGVDTLAIESNYCPRLQAASDRPEFLKRRIMGGAGHLSNEEAADAVRRIGPREHAVFLHLSRQCNTPCRVAALHEGADYARTIASQEAPTRWVWVTPAPEAPVARPPRERSPLRMETMLLFAGEAAGTGAGRP